VATRKAFLIRLDPAVLTALEGWAADDLRSVNGQIEFVLREGLRRAGRKLKPAGSEAALAAIPAKIDPAQASPGNELPDAAQRPRGRAAGRSR